MGSIVFVVLNVTHRASGVTCFAFIQRVRLVLVLVLVLVLLVLVLLEWRVQCPCHQPHVVGSTQWGTRTCRPGLSHCKNVRQSSCARSHVGFAALCAASPTPCTQCAYMFAFCPLPSTALA